MPEDASKSKERNPQIQTTDYHLRNYVISLHFHQVMHKHEFNLMKVRRISSKAKIILKLDLTVSDKQTGIVKQRYVM
jgi:hypothetical protein